MTFTDAELLDYLSGKLGADKSAALEQALATDETLETRLLTFERRGAADLRDAVQALPIADRVQAIADSLPVQTEPSFSRSRWPGAIAAGIAAVVMAGAFFFAGQDQTPVRWQEQVAIYQALYVTETLAVVEPSPAEIDAQLKRSATALGRPLQIEAVGQLDGLSLLRSQILGFEGKPLIQMAYLSEEGVPVALCIVHLGEETEGIVPEALAGLQSVHWSDGTYSYMIVGDIAQDRLMTMARDVSGLL